jgi:hypothetical protein
MVRVLALCTLMLVACGDDGYVVSAQRTNPQPSQPDIVTEDDTPTTAFKDPRGIQLVDAPDTEPRFIPPYWITFEPSRLYILALPGTVGPKTEKLKIHNRGTEHVRLRSISVRDGVANVLSDGGAAVFDITQLPDKDTLAPGETTEIEITFYPTTSTMVSGTISVLTDMPTNPERAVPVTAKSFR